MHFVCLLVGWFVCVFVCLFVCLLCRQRSVREGKGREGGVFVCRRGGLYVGLFGLFVK